MRDLRWLFCIRFYNVGNVSCQSVQVAGIVLTGLFSPAFELIDGWAMIKQRVYIIDVLVAIAPEFRYSQVHFLWSQGKFEVARKPRPRSRGAKLLLGGALSVAPAMMCSP